jgi:NDP-mannose synthase
MKALILAGGLGSRLKPFTEAIPKPLLPVGEKAVLEIQIERLREFGFDDIILATNYKADYIERFLGDGSTYGVRIRVNREETPLGTAGPIALLEEGIDEPFLVMNGDILSLVDFGRLYRFALERGTVLTIAVKRQVTPYDFGNIYFDGDFVTDIEEKPDLITYILAGIYVMRPEIFRYIPKDTYFGMDHLIKRLLTESQPIAKYDLEEYWLDIGRIDDYERAQSNYRLFSGAGPVKE